MRIDQTRNRLFRPADRYRSPASPPRRGFRYARDYERAARVYPSPAAASSPIARRTSGAIMLPMTEQRVKRRYIRRAPRRNRTLTSADWVELQTLVLRRDAAVVAATLRERLDPLIAARLMATNTYPCPAWVIEGGEIRCEPPNTWRLDHIQEGYGRMGVKADDHRLVSLCAVHDERGMKAGHQWNTANRPALRDYLERFGE